MKQIDGVLLNGVCWTAGCAAIAYACKITGSAKPLWAMLLIPRFNVTINGGAASGGTIVDGVAKGAMNGYKKAKERHDNVVEFDAEKKEEE